MTATVTGFCIMQGYLSSLDTLLPSAWTSSNPQLVGLWCQRVCKCTLQACHARYCRLKVHSITAVVLFFLLFVSLTYILSIRAETNHDVQAYKRCLVLLRVDLVVSQARPRSRTLRRDLPQMATPGATRLRI